MSNIISVISPVHGQGGNTIAASGIALTLSIVQTKETVCLTHGDFGRTTLLDIMGKESTEDKTANLAQAVTQLADKGASSHSQMSNVTKSLYGKNLFLYTSGEQTRSQEEVTELYSSLITRLPYDYVVIDVDTGLDHYLTDLSLKLSDTIIIVVNQNKETIKRYFDWYTPLYKSGIFKDKKVLYMVNKYDTSIGMNMSAQLKTKPNTIMTLHYNSLIAKLCNEGYVQEAFEKAYNRDGTVIEIHSEMRTIISKLLGKKGNWRRPAANAKHK